jgi:hypothetical protein
MGRYRDENGIGASDIVQGCGDLVAADGTVVARISYAFVADSLSLCFRFFFTCGSLSFSQPYSFHFSSDR